MEMTVELDDRKKPPAGDLPKLWEANRHALLREPLVALFGGVRGHVRTAKQGAAGAAAAPAGARVVLRRFETAAAAAAAAAGSNASRGGSPSPSPDGSFDFDAYDLLYPPLKTPANTPLGFGGWELGSWVAPQYGGFHRPAAPGAYLAIAFAPGHLGRARVVTVPEAAADGTYPGVVVDFV